MMRKRSTYLLLFAATAMAMSGGQTAPNPPAAKASVTGNADQPSTPFLDREQYSSQLGRAIDDSFRKHRFTRPWIAVRGPDGAVWFVAERIQSEDRFDRIYVQVTPEEKVTASITRYQFHASDWAILGKLFAVTGDDYRLEAKEIAGELTHKFNSERR